MIEAVKNNGRSLQYASEELKKDKEFMIEVVKQADVRFNKPVRNSRKIKNL
jgi:hypothetical protein